MKRWTGKALEELFLLPIPEVAKKYNVTEGYVRTQRYRVKQRIKKREKKVEQGYRPDREELEEIVRLREILQDFKDAGLPVDPEDADQVASVKVWQMGYTDADGEGHVQTLRGVELKPQSNVNEAELIRNVPPVIIKPAKSVSKKSKDKVAFIVPDLQGGFRRHTDDTLEPIHDESVVDVGLQLIRHTQPDLIVLNGDNLDFPDLSHFDHDSSHFQNVMQMTLDRVYEILCTMRASAPDAQIVWLAGNHEHRLNKQILKHNMHLWGVRRPGTDEYPFLSIPHIMNLAGIDVDYVSGYPANRFKINDRLQAIHGHKVRSGGSTAAMYAKDEELSTIFGHVHRLEVHSRTNRLGRAVTAMSFGTWARIDGAVPSYGNGVDDMGRVVPQIENWQNGAGVIEYQDGDKPFQMHPILIDPQEGYETHFDGKLFRPS